jgi:putative phosphoribosyl transferase
MGDDQLYRDRQHAGAELAVRLNALKGHSDVVVLALPRGGVPVAYEVARALGAPLDVVTARKLGVPGHCELAMGAIASGNVLVLDADIVAWYRIPNATVEAVVQQERTELSRREHAYREGRAPVQIRDRVVVLIDDGLATGSTMKAAVQTVRAQNPSRIVVAVPVGAPETCRQFTNLVDEVVCTRMPPGFGSVGQWYRDFSQTTDEEVRELLRDAISAGSEAGDSRGPFVRQPGSGLH